MLIAEMDYAGVDWALNHVDMSLDKGNDYFAAAVHAYPDRLRSMISIEEWRIASEPDAVLREIADAIASGLHAVKVMPEYAYKMSREAGFDEPSWRPFWMASRNSACRSSSASAVRPASPIPGPRSSANS